MKLDYIKKEINSAKEAGLFLTRLNKKEREDFLIALADEIKKNIKLIIISNAKDIRNACKENKAEGFVKRLSLDEFKIGQIANSIRRIARLPDYVGNIIEEKKRPSGIVIKKQIIPLGLIAIIYESRPNVTLDAFTLAFKSGNAVLLKGGKEIKNTNKILINIIQKLLIEFCLPPDIVKDFSGISSELAKELMTNEKIDCLIPRGGKGLINYVRNEAKVPVIITGASVVHTYVSKKADLDLAAKVVLNAKIRNVAICNALDTLLVNENILEKFIKKIIKKLEAAKVELRVDEKSYKILKRLNYPYLKKANKGDYGTEFLDYTLNLKKVAGLEEALAHIKKYTLGHSEAIISRSKEEAQTFFNSIDAACLYWNTSTQFSDGGEFGLGSEIGISTQKLHARGPFGYEALTTYKYLVESRGATRK